MRGIATIANMGAWLLVWGGLCSAADLSGNWMAAVSLGDGTTRRTYFNLKQDGSRISGWIRVRQFYYSIAESSGGPGGFTITGSMKDGNMDRTAVFEGRLQGDELRIAERRPDGLQPELIAHRAPDGEGVLPARLPPPALHRVPDNGLARTPPMGWNSWNKFAGRVNDEIVRGIAAAIASNGMKEAGYVYINLDDTWEGERDSQGTIHPNNKFPDMKALADYVHGKGLKIGIYSSPGPDTCAGYEGSYGHEAQDARTYAAWGIDYLKYDWCGARAIYSDSEMQAVYQIMGDALLAAGRPIVFSLCQYGRADVWKWGPQVGGNLWRTTGDIRDRWDSMERIGFGQNDLAQYSGPGHWNDPDMLEIGNGSMTGVEYRTHMTLWSMLAAPLIAGNDVRSMPASILEILTNREVVAVDQDQAGHQGRRVWKSGDREIWVRDLSGGDRAVALFNRGADTAVISLKWADLALPQPLTARDLWTHSRLKLQGPEYAITVPAHGATLLRVQ